MTQNSYMRRQSGLAQTTPAQPTPPASTARQPKVSCMPAHHSPLQYLNKVFWCNQLSMWDCNCTPDHPLIFPHQHQSTNHASFDKMFTFYVYMQICTLLALNILTITIRKRSSLTVFHRQDKVYLLRQISIHKCYLCQCQEVIKATLTYA